MQKKVPVPFPGRVVCADSAFRLRRVSGRYTLGKGRQV